LVCIRIQPVFEQINQYTMNMIRNATLGGLLGLTLLGASCSTTNDVTPDSALLFSDFRTSRDGWAAEYTDYSEQLDTTNFEFRSAHVRLPAPLDTTKRSLMVATHNRSDDLFTYIKRKVTGLQPNTTYRLVFEVELASQYATNSVGIGGSPGSSVYLKAGASAIEPRRVKEGDYFTLNIDKGNQASGGKDALVLGHIGAGNDVNRYRLIQRNNISQPLPARTNERGELWVFIGTDSGFEGLTTLYYNRSRISAL